MFQTKQIQHPAIHIVTINEAIFNSKLKSIKFIVTDIDTGITFDFTTFLYDSNGNKKQVEYEKIKQLLFLLDLDNTKPDETNHFSDIENKKIGLLLSSYTNKKGNVYLASQCWIDPETKQTSWEKRDNLPAKYAYEKLNKLQGR
jgi:hypothetical protein